MHRSSHVAVAATLAAIAALAGACSLQPTASALQPSAPASNTPPATAPPTPQPTTARGIFVLATESLGPRCDRLLLDPLAVGRRVIDYTVDLPDGWRQESDGFIFEWTSATGIGIREGDLVEVSGVAVADPYCHRDAPVMHAETLLPVTPAGRIDLTVTFGPVSYFCIEGCVRWVRFSRDGELIGQRALRDDDPWHLEPGIYQLDLLEASCFGLCAREVARPLCSADITLTADRSQRLTVAPPSDRIGAESHCVVAFGT